MHASQGEVELAPGRQVGRGRVSSRQTGVEEVELVRGRQASKQEGKQASKQTSKQADMHASQGER